MHEQRKAETFMSESGDMLAKEVGTDAKGFEEFAMWLNTIKTRLDFAREPLRIARLAVDALATNYADLSVISMEDLVTTQEWLESEFTACRDIVDNPKAIYNVLTKESESKEEPVMEHQGPRIELSDESLDEEELEVASAEEGVLREAELDPPIKGEKRPPGGAAHETSSEPTCHLATLEPLDEKEAKVVFAEEKRKEGLREPLMKLCHSQRVVSLRLNLLNVRTSARGSLAGVNRVSPVRNVLSEVKP